MGLGEQQGEHMESKPKPIPPTQAQRQVNPCRAATPKGSSGFELPAPSLWKTLMQPRGRPNPGCGMPKSPFWQLLVGGGRSSRAPETEGSAKGVKLPLRY